MSPRAHAPAPVTCYSVCSIKWKVRGSTNCSEQSPLPFTHRVREAVIPTSIKENPQAELTQLKQVREWAFSARRMWLRCTSASCPQMSVMMTVWDCAHSLQSQDKPVVLGGQRRCSYRHLSSWCTQTKGLVSVCVCIHWHRSNIFIRMHAYACVDTCVCVHKCANLKQNSSGPWDKEEIRTSEIFLSIWQ